ncbi:MAG: hypothetical protein JRF31_12795 [Deltaproteobacteria bacterium]|nr:hypothetical protein [Deltaproteobacteria bacterium]MBW2321680.1 hypothetical protein [Deltaproteobacteria bacterium]
MDINRIYDLIQGQQSSPKKMDSDCGFKQVFDKKINEINEATMSTSMGGKADVIKHGDKILNLLDDYTRDLADPAKTLKDIGPLVKNIEKEVSLIEAESADAVHNDEALKKIIKDLAVTANVAVYKFHRGDYI